MEPCKACGYCPTCGRRPDFYWQPLPWSQPYFPPTFPYLSTPWWGGSGTITVGDTTSAITTGAAS